MTEVNEKAIGQSDKRYGIAALVLLAGGAVSGVLSVVTIILGMDDGWLAKHPWHSAASLLIPLGMVSQGVGLMSTGVKKWIFVVVAIGLVTVGVICALMAVLA